MMELTDRLRVNPFLSKYQRLIKFGMVGASGTVLGLGVLYVFTDIVGLYYLVSSIIAFACSVSNNYAWNSLWTFRDRKVSSAGYVRYVGANLTGLTVNMTVLWLLTSVAGVWYLYSAIIAVLCAFLVDYALSKKFVWTKERR